MTKEQVIRLSLAELAEVVKDMAFLVVADQAPLNIDRLAACLSTLERVQLRLMRQVLEQKDVLGPQEAQMKIRDLLEQLASKEGGLAKILRTEQEEHELLDKLKTAIQNNESKEALLALFARSQPS